MNKQPLTQKPSARLTVQSKNKLNLDTFIPSRYTLLVVDDDDDQRYYFERVLSQQGFKVFSACCAREAISLMRKNEINLVISDIMMPGASGLEFITYLRNNSPISGAKDLPIVLLTSSYENLEAIAIEKGADFFCHRKEALSILPRQIRLLLETRISS